MAKDISDRPSPETFLSRLREEDYADSGGKLKIFLGAAPGVGKTFSMLDAARVKRAEGLDVIVGIVETHGRKETAAALLNLEVLPRREIDYHGKTLLEFDLDAARLKKSASRTDIGIQAAAGSRNEVNGNCRGFRWSQFSINLDSLFDRQD